MTPFLLYQLKVAASLAAFTLLYYLLFRKETFYRFNRFYLLTSLVLAHLLPVVKLPIRQVNFQTTIPDYGDIGAVDYTALAQTSFQSAPAINVPLLVYGGIAAVIASYLIYQLISMVVLVIRKNVTRLGSYRLILLPEKNQSFSFFNLIFLNAALDDADHNNQVLQHELAHARQLHSLDIFIIQVVKIFQWFNPFIYLTEKAMQETHEYLADQAVMEQNGGIDQYRLLLLTQVFGIQPGIFSYFNYSLIKNRLIMMTKEKSPFRNRLKYLVVVPLLILLSLMICDRYIMSQEPSEKQLAKAVITKPITDVKNITESYLAEYNQIVSDFQGEPGQAKFQGGTLDDFRKWVQTNLVYPPEAKKEGISGQVFVVFKVNSSGKVSDIRIIRGLNPLLDKEAIRVVGLSPDWTPATKDGKNIDSEIGINIDFSLDNKEFVYYSVDQQAQFQGGTLEDFRKWIQINLVYPPTAKEKGIFGRVTVQFTVNSKGKACDAVILRGVDPSLNEEVLRVIQKSPEWTPAENDGKKVAQQFVIPVIFSLKKKPGVSEESPYKYDPEILDASIIVEGEPTFVFVEEQASFQGGSLETFREWVQKNLVYPAVAKENGIFGRVTMQFAVNSQGKIYDVKVLRGVDPSLDKEAIRIITSSPDWVPAKQGGKNVKQQFVMPVVFSLEKKEVAGDNPDQANVPVIVEKELQAAPENQQDEPAFVFVEQQATFQGGSIDKFREWVQKNLVYPAIAKEDGIFGRVTMQFAINSQGKVCDVKVLRGVDPSLDKEAIRVVTSSPDWAPASQGGRKVKQQFVMPVVFELPK
ncbi:MAG: M56 family metallopeptidase [Bacteroidales bacterium]